MPKDYNMQVDRHCYILKLCIICDAAIIYANNAMIDVHDGI